MNNPKITIITATYNAESSIAELIDSINIQTYKNIEWIVVDNLSTDKTIEIVRQCTDTDFRVICEPDRGIYDAWNKGLKVADGDWIYFMGADDKLFSPNIMDQVAAHLSNTNSSVYWVYGQVVVQGSNGSQLVAGKPWEDVRHDFLSCMSVPHQGVFHRRELFALIGAYDGEYKISGDYELLLRAFIKGLEPNHIPKVFCIMGGSGVSSQIKSSQIMLDEYVSAKRKNQVYPIYTKKLIKMYALVYLKLLIGFLFGDNFLRKLINCYRNAARKPLL